jgi:hypothetical protein
VHVRVARILRDRWPTRGPTQVTALVVAHLQGRPPPEALSRTRFGIFHLWSIDSRQFRLPPEFALYFQDEYLYPPVQLWPPND